MKSIPQAPKARTDKNPTKKETGGVGEVRDERDIHTQAVDMLTINSPDCDIEGFEFDENWRPLPPYTNRGGMNINPDNSLSPDYPKLTPPTPKISAIVDWFSCTFSLDQAVTNRKVKRVRRLPVSDSGKLSAIQYEDCPDDYYGDDVERVTDITAPDIEVGRRLVELQGIVSNLDYLRNERGMFGYKRSVTLYRDGKCCGSVAWDSKEGGCLISLTGCGTSGVDMRSLHRFIMSLPSPKITRVDFAHDDLDGRLSINDWLNIYDTGAFHIRGKMPGRRMIDDFDSGKGKTLYVGNKANGKECCIYEKGKEQGDTESQWVRVEGRLSSTDRVIPLDVLLFPEMYLAGLYPAFSFICAFHERVDVIKKQTVIAYDMSVRFASLQVGKLINVMVELGQSSEQIIKTLIRPGIPKRLQLPLIA